LLSTDPAWEYRQDGGKSFFPNLDSSAWTKHKKKGGKGGKGGKGKAKEAAAEDVVMDEEEAALNADAAEEVRDLAGFTKTQIEEMSGSPFRVVRVRDDGNVSLCPSLAVAEMSG
jgi:hypothetical protein